jgi:ribosomal protein S10
MISKGANEYVATHFTLWTHKRRHVLHDARHGQLDALAESDFFPHVEQ